jgi:hypothetical protein
VVVQATRLGSAKGLSGIALEEVKPKRKTNGSTDVEAGAGHHGSATTRATFGQRSPSIFDVLKVAWPQAGGPSFACAVPETKAILSRVTVPELTGGYPFEQIAISMDGQKATFGGGREWPNSTAVRVDGRELIFPRAVRPYTNKIDLEAKVFNAPEHYVSDVPLMERIGERTVHLKTLLVSNPEKIVFEDPRISTIRLDPRADPITLLSFTEYQPKEGIIQNRAVILERDPSDGTFKVPEVDAIGRPKQLINFSPAGLDAKNGVLYQNDAGEIVLRSRMRGFDLCPSYAEQVWVFANWSDFLAYQKDWKGWHEDLSEGFHNAGRVEPRADRVRPLRANVVATEASFPELYDEQRLAAKKTQAPGESPHYRGFGPGTRPVRLEREGDKLYFSDGPSSPKHYAGTIPLRQRDRFVLGDGEVKTLTFDHQLRVLELDVDGLTIPRRVYTGSFKLWNADADRIELIYADALQPVTPHSRGGGIADLEHVYPEGWVEVPGKSKDDPARVALYCGVADASTERTELDLVTLLLEMSEGSKRWATGQVGPPLC